MARFDAELYLRLLGEEMLMGSADRPRGRFWSLVEAASALVAVGAISEAQAQSVLEDCGVALMLRGDRRAPPRRLMAPARGPRRKGKALKPPRVVPCGCALGISEGTLQIRYVSLREEATRLAVTWRSDAAGRPSSRTMFGGGPGPLVVGVADDRGERTDAGFSGGGSEGGVRGRLTAFEPLAVDTAWIEVNGIRIQLDSEPASCEVSIERRAELDPAHRYLWQRLADLGHFDRTPAAAIADALDALVRAGALASDDPVTGQVRAVAEALCTDHAGEPPPGKQVPLLPEPWRSLFSRRGREDGPEDVVPLCAVTPEFDGYSVGVMSLESHSSGFTVDVEISGWQDWSPPDLVRVRAGRLAWWAADDRDNHYLGRIGSRTGGENHSEGIVNFWPALDPKAARLDLMPTGDTSRAVIRVPLEWTTAAGSAAEAPA